MSSRPTIVIAVLAACAAPWPAPALQPVCLASQEEPPPASPPPQEPAPAPEPAPQKPEKRARPARHVPPAEPQAAPRTPEPILEDPVQINENANRLVAAGRLQAAYDQYRKAVQINPDLAVAWNNLGVVSAALGKYGEGESAYLRAIRVKDDYALARYNLGVLYDNQGKYDPAIEQYQKAIELDPGLLDVRRNPQVASNRHLAAVLVKSYLDRGGSVLLPVESALPPPAPRKKRGA